MKLSRHILGRDGSPTLGRLVSRDGAFACVTLERSADGDHPCIPAGTYHVTIDTHHPGTPGAYRCPELLDVPGRSQIQIHIGNCCDDLQGCIAPGERESADGLAIEESGSAFRRLMAYLEGAPLPFELTVEDPA